MSTKSKKELIVLAVVLLALSVSIYSQMSGSTPPAYNSTVKTERVRQRSAESASEVLKMQALEDTAPNLSGVKRNIFQFGSRPIIESAPKPVLRVPSPPTETAPAIPDVHYLGFYFEKETGLMLASIVNGGKIYVGKVGQILGGKYEVLEIASDHVMLRLTEDGKVLRVPIGRGPANIVNWAAMGPKGEQK
jgi:hypothetical protein